MTILDILKLMDDESKQDNCIKTPGDEAAYKFEQKARRDEEQATRLIRSIRDKARDKDADSN